jgi:replicative DNA helicase
MSTDAQIRAWESLRDESGPFEFEFEYVMQRPPAPTGIRPLDDRLGGGLHSGTYTIIGGDPGSGKTAIACKACYTLAQCGMFPIFYSFEMTKMQLVSRLLSVHTRVNRDRLPTVRWAALRDSLLIGRDELRRLADADGRAQYEAVMRYVGAHRADDAVLAAWYDFRDTVYPHMIVRDDVQDIDQVAREVAALCESGLHPCVIVDYLQLAAAGDKDEYQLVTNASHVLQKMAKRHNIPVLLVSSLRNLNKSERDDEPQLSQFRGSGHVGYDAGAAIVLRRSGGLVTHKGVGLCQRVTAHVIKNRFGEVGEVDLDFNGALNVFAPPMGDE